jgi:LuxR family maltose regulon positive regulatory protein
VGSEAAELLATSQPALHEAILTSLINDLDRVNTDIVLVLDDYQSISNQAVHEAVTFLLEHCPRSFHLVIASRSDPPLHIARLRIRGQIVELRAADLRFTETESAQFLNDVMHLHLDVGSVAALAERTEGWIAGLQMAALSMRDRENVREFIAKFSGTNRYILDYLIEEVLASQPPETHHFLLYTSILERLSAPLCKAVLEDDGLEGRRTGQNPAVDQLADIHLYQQTLEDIERANLFLVPLDDERTWYRYHHLFADLLRTQLQKAIGERGVTQLHLRAAAWHEQNGSLLDAIHHASLVSDEGRVERLIEQLYLEMVSRGEMWGYRFWSGKLSKELV